MSLKRIAREMRQLEDDEDGIAKSTGGSPQIAFLPSPDGNNTTPSAENYDPYNFKGLLQGPTESPYSGGIFTLHIHLPADYPWKPPQIRFETRIWHPNVNFVSGQVAIDILTTQWSVAWTIQHVLLAILSTLTEPLIHSDDLPSVNMDAELQYRKNRPQFIETARFWTGVHAGTTPREQTAMVQRLQDMGFGPAAHARCVLERCGWDEASAVQELLSLYQPQPNNDSGIDTWSAPPTSQPTNEDTMLESDMKALRVGHDTEDDSSWSMVEPGERNEGPTSSNKGSVQDAPSECESEWSVVEN